MESSNPRKILVFVDWYVPGYKAGGPIRSVANLVARLPHEFSIVTSNCDHMASEPYANLPSGEWVKGERGERIMYLEPATVNPKRLRTLMREQDYDVIYINSIFSLRFALMPLQAAKRARGNAQVIVAPRGMLKKGALSVKAKKKKLFLKTSKVLGLFKRVRWHATNNQERAEIRKVFGDVPSRVAPNLVASLGEVKPPPEKQAGTVRLVAVARVSPEKNVLNALKFLAGANRALGKVELTWYGTQQDQAYLQQCLKAAEAMPHHSITFPGDIHPDHVPEVLADAHFFYLPTLGENFGHAIVEAFMSGTPVLISDRTPWHKLEGARAGWELPLDRILFSEMIGHMVALDQEGYAPLAAGAARFGKRIANNPKDLQRNLDLFDD